MISANRKFELALIIKILIQIKEIRAIEGLELNTNEDRLHGGVYSYVMTPFDKNGDVLQHVTCIIL